MKSLTLVLILLCVFIWMKPAKAVDPATVAAAAPKALELAVIWSPYAASTLQSCGVGLWKIGESTFQLLYLPWGLVQCTLGAPFGFFSDGISSLFDGIKAPFILGYQLILFPVRLLSLGAVK
jgi:hypothetical protein